MCGIATAELNSLYKEISGMQILLKNEIETAIFHPFKHILPRSTNESTVAKLEDLEIQILKNVAYSQVHYPRGSLPNPPLAIHPRTEAIPQEGVYETIPGEVSLCHETVRMNSYELMNPREGSLIPPTTTESQPEAAYEMVTYENINC